MEEKHLPNTVLLHRSSNSYYHQLKRILNNWNVDIIEASVLAEIRDRAILDSIPLAIAIVDKNDISGIDFLRSTMQSNNWIQRIMLYHEADADIFERAVNKAHINYLLKIPAQVSNLETYFRKALRRFDSVTRPFEKLDTLSHVAEELWHESEKFRMEASLDPLTKLMNRRSFNKIFERIYHRFKERGISFSLALIDLDHFKIVNDTYGHVAGDQVLQSIAEILTKNQRIGIDYTFRYGGEEFAILSSTTNVAEMNAYLERLRKIVEQHSTVYKEQEIKITFSSGVCEVDFETNPEELIARADKALYQAKDNGRNQVVLFDNGK